MTYTVDTSAPQISITAPVDGSRLRQGQVVLADYACTDEDGPADVMGCPGNAGKGAPIDTSTPGSKSFTVESEDRAGNTSSKTVHYFVDASTPQISITTPVDGGSYARGATAIAGYACTDDDGPADVKSCAGTVAAGAAIDTSTPGTRSFTVETVDQAGNARSKTVSYTVVDDGSPLANTIAGLPPITPPAAMPAAVSATDARSAQAGRRGNGRPEVHDPLRRRAGRDRHDAVSGAARTLTYAEGHARRQGRCRADHAQTDDGRQTAPRAQEEAEA